MSLTSNVQLSLAVCADSRLRASLLVRSLQSRILARRALVEVANVRFREVRPLQVHSWLKKPIQRPQTSHSPLKRLHSCPQSSLSGRPPLTLSLKRSWLKAVNPPPWYTNGCGTCVTHGCTAHVCAAHAPTTASPTTVFVCALRVTVCHLRLCVHCN